MRWRKKEPSVTVLERQLKYAYIGLRKAGMTSEDAGLIVYQAERSYRFVHELENLPGEDIV